MSEDTDKGAVLDTTIVEWLETKKGKKCEKDKYLSRLLKFKTTGK